MRAAGLDIRWTEGRFCRPIPVQTGQRTHSTLSRDRTMATALRTDLSIRPGQRRDAADLAVLVDIAAEGMASYMWRETAGIGESPVSIGRARALREEGGFSYRNAYMAEIDGEVAGTMVGYPLFGESSDLRDIPPLYAGWSSWNWRCRTTGTSTCWRSIPSFAARGIGTRSSSMPTPSAERRTPRNGHHSRLGQRDRQRFYRPQGYRVFRRAAPSTSRRPRGSTGLLTKPMAEQDERTGVNGRQNL